MPTPIGPRRVDELAANLPERAWERRSAGAGSKGPRYYSWAWLALAPNPPPTQVSRRTTARPVSIIC